MFARVPSSPYITESRTYWARHHRHNSMIEQMAGLTIVIVVAFTLSFVGLLMALVLEASGKMRRHEGCALSWVLLLTLYSVLGALVTVLFFHAYPALPYTHP